jgi:hypothetical protein
MPISIDWGTKVIYVPQSYLTPLGGGLYELDTDQFRLDLKDLEDDAEGMAFPDTHRHVTETVLGGVTYARFVEIINGYSIEFENGMYAVRLTGSNNNVEDVAVVNSVSIRTFNSAGLIVSSSATVAPTQQQIRDAMTLAATLIPAAGSIDDQLADIFAAAGLTPSQAAQLLDLWRRHGLDISNPLVSDRIAGTITAGSGLSQTVTTLGDVDTITRTP